jgi:peptidoglycan/xylan/chitin deacetylase (PgdA/CDA1 family)
MRAAEYFKSVLLKTMTIPAVPELISSITGTEVVILMLHRFAVPETGIEGHDPALVRKVLAYLRQHRYELVSLGEVFHRLRGGEPLRRAVAFTIDDGYFDQAEIGAPVFAEFDCPVTIFTTTGFLDGRDWMWWDKIQYIFDHAQQTGLDVALGDWHKTYRLDSAKARLSAASELAARCESVSRQEIEAAIGELRGKTGVEPPASPPAAFAPMSWEQARLLESRGVTFGPHSVSHPILANAPAEDAEREIAESWKRVQEELSTPVPVFCYPGGRGSDFGAREMAAVRRGGMWGAVQAAPGRIRAAGYRDDTSAIFRVPRQPLDDDFARVLKTVSGLEDLVLRVRGMGASDPI